MKITLRQAAALQTSIQSNIGDITGSISCDQPLSVYVSDPTQRIKDMGADIDKKLTQVSTLNQILYQIRKSVSAANQAAGINDFLADLASLNKRISVYETVVSEATPVDLLDVLGRIERAKNPSNQYPMETVHVSALTQAQIDGYENCLKTLRRQRDKIKDDLISLNVTTKIELDDDSVAVLTEQGLI